MVLFYFPVLVVFKITPFITLSAVFISFGISLCLFSVCVLASCVKILIKVYLSINFPKARFTFISLLSG